MFFIIRFTISWLIWLIFADKKRWSEILPISIFAGLLGSTSDNIIAYHKIWYYKDELLSSTILTIMDDWGIYIVVPYLFIQHIPKNQSFYNISKYIFKWTLFSIVLEWFHLHTGHMEHNGFWNLGMSYISDWILYFTFYYFHKLFQFGLSKVGNKRLEDLGDIVVLLDEKGRVTNCFSKWLKDNAFDPNNEVGKSVDEISGISAEIHYKAFEKVFLGKTTSFNFNWIAPNNQNYYFKNTLSPITNNDNNVIGIFSIINEVNSDLSNKNEEVLN